VTERILDWDTLTRVGRLWRLTFVMPSPGLVPPGSPDRCLARAVVCTDTGQRLLVEQFSPEQAVHKMEIAATLQALCRAGLGEVNPCIATGDGQYVVPLGRDYWQISPYMEGEPLPRPDWVWQRWRGEALASFLCELESVARAAPLPPRFATSPRAFVSELMQVLAANRPELAHALEDSAGSLLQEWLPAEDRLGTAFCHGDPHPLNVIWAPDSRIRAVIDWEFSGWGPAAGDWALILGCVGIEQPQALCGPFVQGLLTGMAARRNPLADASTLWSLVVANRFAWLSDWLRRQDEEMVALEQEYIALLIRGRAQLQDTWSRYISCDRAATTALE
jgi:homoserine kinase type II